MSKEKGMDKDLNQWAEACKSGLTNGIGAGISGGAIGNSGGIAALGQQTLQAGSQDCPHCGKCRECGRGGYQTRPYYPGQYTMPYFDYTYRPYPYYYTAAYGNSAGLNEQTTWLHSNGTTTTGPR